MKASLILAVVVAAAFANATAFPAFAKENNGAFGQSAEGNKPQNNACEGYRESFVDFARASTTAADDAARKWYNDTAIEYWKEAKALGCGWVKTNALKNGWTGTVS